MCPNVYQHLDITLPVVNDMTPDVSVFTHTAVFDLLRHPTILDVTEDILDSNPTQHRRLKVPGGYDATMWHQDLPYLPGEALASGILTVLIALTDAVVENGCLLVIAGSHRHRSETLPRHVIDTPGESNCIPFGEPAPGSVLKDAQVRTGL